MTKVHRLTGMKRRVLIAGATLALGGLFATTSTIEADAAEWNERAVTEIKTDIQNTDKIEYEIKWGDTLGNIAEALDMPLNTLATANGIGDIHYIVTGQTLVISENSEGQTEVEVKEQSVTTSSSTKKEEPKAEAKPKAESKQEAKAEPIAESTDARTAFNQLVAEYGLSQAEADAWAELITRESNWQVTVSNAQGSSAYGLPQALPGSKMASEGSDWRTNPRTQLKWMKKYVVDGRYGSFQKALAHHDVNNWY